MKAKHHRRRGHVLKYPNRPPGPQNPWIAPAVQRKSPMAGTRYELQPKFDRLRAAMDSAVRELVYGPVVRLRSLERRGLRVTAHLPGLAAAPGPRRD
jgi:hypothetical protein